MKTRTTYRNFQIDLLNWMVTGAILLFSIGSFSQAITITDFNPKRVTVGTKLTIKGENFNDAALYYLDIVGDDINVGSKLRVSETEMTCEIVSSRTSDGFNRIVTIGNGNNAVQTIDFIAPRDIILTKEEPFYVSEIYTNWNYRDNGFWRSDDWKTAPGIDAKELASPDDRHELLGFKMQDGKIYSTGVNDSILELKLGITQEQIEAESIYKRKVYKAYSTNGVRGKTSALTYLMTGDRVDGIKFDEEEPSDFPSLTTSINDLNILEVIIDGVHGLDLGTAIGNFNDKTDVQFYSGNPQTMGSFDGPDLLITQMADPGKSDVYYYADSKGNVIGRPINLKINKIEANSTKLAEWKLNLFTYANGLDFATATPNGRDTQWHNPPYRAMRMVAFKLSDFEIEESDISRINNVNMNSGGQADIAFMAYSQERFDIKGPVAKTILPRYICRLGQTNGDSDATFHIKIDVAANGGNVGIEDYLVPGNIRAPKPEDGDIEFKYQLWKDGDPITPMTPNISSLTIPNVTSSELGIYKLRIENGQGTIIVPVEIAEGGTPTIWNGTTWSSLPYIDVDDEDRKLFFAKDYNVSIDLVGCDCYVANKTNVVIPENKTLKLHGAITVAPEIQPDANFPDGVPAGTFTLKNNASLIQTKDVAENQNRGDIIVERDAVTENKYDYVYWSSPVMKGNLSMIPGATSHVYEWDVNFKNDHNGTYGNWVKPNPETDGLMEIGRGYIKRVNAATTINTSFNGVPNNGVIILDVEKTNIAASMSTTKHMNLIGNPYPSAISAETFLQTNAAKANTNASLEGYLQVWTHDKEIFIANGEQPFYGDFKYNYGDQYATYNITGEVPRESFEGFIASGQGFFVQVLDAAVTPFVVTFNNRMRYKDGEPTYDNTDFKRPSGPSKIETLTEKQLLWLSLVNENKMSSVTLLGYVDGATNGKDRLYDAGSGPGTMRIYSRIDDEDFLIQGRALPFDENDQVPLGIEVLKNGIYNIGIDHLKGSQMLNQDQGIYLEDTYNNVIHNLRASPYGFTATQGDIKDRFVLRYTDQQLSVEDQQMKDTFVYIKNNQLFVKAAQHIQSIEVYDLSGKRLLNHILDGHTDRFNAPFQFSKGAYLAIINLQDSGRVTKKVLN